MISPHVYDENVHTEKMQERMTQTVKQNILINKTVFFQNCFLTDGNTVGIYYLQILQESATRTQHETTLTRNLNNDMLKRPSLTHSTNLSKLTFKKSLSETDLQPSVPTVS